jgi:hypothetical protein
MTAIMTPGAISASPRTMSGGIPMTSEKLEANHRQPQLLHAVTPHEDGSTALLPARRVLDRYGICARTLGRWVKDESVGFPKPIVVHRRRYWRVSELAAFERRRAAKAS